MPRYAFRRTVKYTETIVVAAADSGLARDLALESDGVRNHDDTVDDITLLAAAPADYPEDLVVKE